MSCPCDEEDALVHSLVGRDKEESMSLLVATLLGPVPGREAVPGAAQRGLVQWDRHRLQYCAVLQGNGLFKYNTSSSVNPIGSRLSIYLSIAGCVIQRALSRSSRKLCHPMGASWNYYWISSSSFHGQTRQRDWTRIFVWTKQFGLNRSNQTVYHWHYGN